jgi:hypothetical protein
MRIDRYTQALLTVIALLLAVIAGRPYFHPPVAAAQAPGLASVHFFGDVSRGFVAVDGGGKLWFYGSGKPELLGQITRPGEPLRGGKWGEPER